MAEFTEPPEVLREPNALDQFLRQPPDVDLEKIEHASKLLRRMSSGGPSTVRLRLLILVAQKPRMRKELASLLSVRQATLTGHLDKLFNMNLVKETTDRKIYLDQSPVIAVIEFLNQNLHLGLCEVYGIVSKNNDSQTTQPTKETTTNV